MTLEDNTNIKAFDELPSGFEVNSDEDEQAGYATANAFKAGMTLISGVSQNAHQVQSTLQRANGAYSRIHGIPVQMKSLATEAASGQQITQDLNRLKGKLNVGAFRNQLQHAVNNLGISIRNCTSSDSTIEDVDMAFVVSNLTKNQILRDSATAMQAQANVQPPADIRATPSIRQTLS